MEARTRSPRRAPAMVKKEVTDKMHDLEHPDEKPQNKHIEIIIPNLPIPEPVEPGDFNVNIEDWIQGGENDITIEN